MNVSLFVSRELGDVVSELICIKTESVWPHVGFYDRDRDYTFSAMCDGNGVSWRALKPKQKVMLLSAPGTQAAFEKALTQEGKPYDFLDIVGIALAQDIHIPDHFICSTLVLWAFEQTGNPLLNMKFIPLDHLTPRDILLSNEISQLE